MKCPKCHGPTTNKWGCLANCNAETVTLRKTVTRKRDGGAKELVSLPSPEVARIERAQVSTRSTVAQPYDSSRGGRGHRIYDTNAERQRAYRKRAKA